VFDVRRDYKTMTRRFWCIHI